MLLWLTSSIFLKLIIYERLFIKITMIGQELISSQTNYPYYILLINRLKGSIEKFLDPAQKRYKIMLKK